MNTPSPERAVNIDPDRWQSRADGPLIFYAAPGQLRALWRLLLFGLAVLVTDPIIESVLTPLFGALTTVSGMRLEAYPWVTMCAVLGGLAFALRGVDRQPWQHVGLDRSAWRLRRLSAGLVLGTAAILATMGLLFLSQSAHVESTRTALDGVISADTVWSTSSWSNTALRLALLLAPAALWEELLFRGYLWTVANDAGGVVLARWSTAIAFGVVHLTNPGAGVVSTLLVIVAGFALGAIRERTGSLAAAWFAHFAWNWVMAAVLHVPVSGVPFDSPGYRIVSSGPSWWTGGAWGPEGGVAALIVLCVALAFGAHPGVVFRRFSESRSLSRTEMSSP